METGFSPEAIAGRERQRAAADGRRMVATAVAIAVFAIAAFALGGAMLDASFSRGQAPAESPETPSPDQRVERLRFAAGQAWRDASERDRVLVLLEWQTEMDDLSRSRGEFNDAVAERHAALADFVGTCLDSTVARGGLALQATVSEIAEGCLEVAVEEAGPSAPQAEAQARERAIAVVSEVAGAPSRHPIADRVDALLQGTGADWAVAGAQERGFVLEAWAWELALTSDQLQSVEALESARRTMAPIGLCMDAATAAGGLPEAQTMPIRDIAATCAGAHRRTVPIEQ